MINILHTIDTTGPGGAETVFVQLATGLDRSLFRSLAAIPGKGWVYDELVRNGIDPILIDAKGSFSLQYLYQLVSIIRKYRVDIIQSHLIGSNVYCSLAGMLCRIPVVSTFHGFVDMKKGDKLLGIRLSIIKYGSSKLVFVSEHLKRYFANQHNLMNKEITIYNGIDLDRYQKDKYTDLHKELGLDNGHLLIGAIGNIRQAKGYDVFLHAASLVFKRNSKCRFIVVGEGSGKLYTDLLALRTVLGLDHIVFFLGYRCDITQILKNIDVFVLPSISEGFSIVTLEAMASRVPVVVTRSGGPEEIVTDESGFLVPSNDHIQLGLSIISLLENEVMKDEYVSNAYDIINNNFSKQIMIRKYEALYKMISTH